MNSFSRCWLVDKDITFLNHGSFGLCPREVLRSQQKIQRLLEREPVYFMTEILKKQLNASRSELSRLVAVDSDGIVFLTNATTAVNTILNSLDLKPNDEIVITNHEYNACKNAVAYYSTRRRLKVRVAKIPFPVQDIKEVIESFEEVITKKTRFILIDHITSQTALILPVEEIIKRYSKEVDIMIDGAHSVGQIPLFLSEINAHYYTSNCHKWLFAPKGSAFLYVRKDRRNKIFPLVISHGYDSYRKDKSRFQVMFDWMGTQDFSPYICIKDAIHFAQKLRGSIKRLMAENHQKVIIGRDILIDALKITKSAPDYMIGSMASLILPERFLKLSSIDKNGKRRLQNILFDRYKIEVPIIRFGKNKLLLRISAQIYNSFKDYEYLAETLTKISKSNL